MAESSWPLPPGAVVGDTQYEQLLMGYVPSGVVGSPADTSVVTAVGTGTRLVTMRANKLVYVRGHMWSSGTSDFTLPSLASNGSGNPRDDLIVIRYTRSTGVVAAFAITGIAAASPVPPAPTQTLSTSGVYEVPVAVVRVASGATTLASGTVTPRDVYLDRTPLLGTQANILAFPGTYVGQVAEAYDSTAGNIRRYWWTGSVWRDLPGQILKATRIVSGNLLSGGGASETTVYSTTLPANTFAAGSAYEVRAEATVGSGVVTPDVRVTMRIKDGSTTIIDSGSYNVPQQGHSLRVNMSAIYLPANSNAVTFNVTAFRSGGASIFDVSGGADNAFLFVVTTLGPASLVASA